MLRTPGTPEESFSDDPLRMLRAARFAAQLDFEVAPEVVAAMTAMADRIEIVSAERVRDELNKLLLSDHPRKGLRLLVDTGLADRVLPELPALRLERDEHHRHKDVYEHTLTVLEQAIDLETDGPDLVLRLAALLHDIGKPRTRRFEPDGRVSFHHHEMVGAKMTKTRMTAAEVPQRAGQGRLPAGRAAPALPRLRQRRVDRLRGAPLRPRRRAAAGPAAQADPLRLHHPQQAQGGGAVADLRRPGGADRRSSRSRRSWTRSGPTWTATRSWRSSGVGPGPVVGEAYKFLLELRLENGPMAHDDAVAALREWWAAG